MELSEIDNVETELIAKKFWNQNLPISARGVVLQALLRCGRQYGLQIIDNIERMCRVRLSTGSLYPTLRQLEREGLVASKGDDDAEQDSIQPRRYFELSRNGRDLAKGMRQVVLALYEEAPLSFDPRAPRRRKTASR
jgi:PadR family transcriptional regulator PadR